jgi:hypothetical protein
MLGEEKTKTLSLCSFNFLLIKMKRIILTISLLVNSAFLLNPQVAVLTQIYKFPLIVRRLGKC